MKKALIGPFNDDPPPNIVNMNVFQCENSAGHGAVQFPISPIVILSCSDAVSGILATHQQGTPGLFWAKTREVNAR